MKSGESFVPHVRRKYLTVQQIGDEVVLYDAARDKAHVLNPTAALVWHYCDGKRTVKEITRLVAIKTEEASPQELIWFALARLNEQELLETPVIVPSNVQRLTRREFITKFSVAAAVIPVVKTLQAPTPQQAASCEVCGPLDPFCCPPFLCCRGGCLPYCDEA